ncbi:uncharacterized protein JCM15063_003254 [Sporobolomyces koalae]|uniref:uncharacterized protein n=1 Tax=Sporobolomyces koalae TaxID=500713 RepID=UPI00317D4458
MESYPTEFTFHPSPLLFVAGLNPAPAPSTPTPDPSGTQNHAPVQPTDPFDILTASLRKTFASRRGFQLWDNSRGQHHDFHTLFVEKTSRFPPLKARPTSSAPPGEPPLALHSPISPLTPTSPLYPDGIIAPIWIRKHRELIPSVFILVLRLYESPSSGGTAVDPAEREEREREQDAHLVREIIDRKRSTLERGIKLAVVLLCSRELLDDPALDVRLSLIRRQSGLDSRASLFVISPVPQSEVTNFVASIRSELWPSAIDYYREHGRRVRRKRARQVPKGGLSDRGWNVRYDYKLALFAEMRSEIEVALKHYEDCYEALVDMFSQPNLLAARTKRWAEAKVLADCVTVKIAKLYLYLNDPSRSLSQLNRHVFRFRQLSESWQISEQTFEFWSWLSKQYRLFGDLTTAALRAGFRLPSLRPPPTPIPTPGVLQPPSPGLMPLNVLQHPGHYYFLSAVCALERRERYRAIKNALENGSAAKPPEGALLHEGKVDHTEVIIELYTKAYEHFKHHGRRRTTYSIASLIASAHASSIPPNAEMAIKFWDRIGRNYRKDGWRELLEGIEETVFECAKEGGKWVEAIKAAWALLAPTSTVSTDRRAQFAQELKSILLTHAPESPEQAKIHFGADLSPILSPRLSFLHTTATIASRVPFQLAISSPATARLSEFTFDTLTVHFNDDRPPLVIQNSTEPASDHDDVERYAISGEQGQTTASLRWNDGTTKVFYGTVSAESAVKLSIDKITLGLSIGSWTLSADLALSETTQGVWYLEKSRTVPLEGDRSVCSIMPRVLNLHVEVTHAAPALVGERYPIQVDIRNDDEIEVDISFVGFVQPGEEGSQTQLTLDEHTSSSLLDSIPLGTLEPGKSMCKTLFLHCMVAPGNRHLDLTIRSSPSSCIADHPAKPISKESNHSLVIPCAQPFISKFDAYVHPRKARSRPVLEFEKVEEGWEGSGEASVTIQLRAQGPQELEVFGFEIDENGPLDARIRSSSLGQLTEDLPLNFTANDMLGLNFNLEVKSLFADPRVPPRMPSVAIQWRKIGTKGDPCQTRIALPPVRALPPLPRVKLTVPRHMTANEPIALDYVLSNPTSRSLHLATHVDSPLHPGSFVFAGPRQYPSIVLAAGEHKPIRVHLVPLVVGKVAIPKFRVFEVEPDSRGSESFDSEGRPVPPPPPKMRELDIELESRVHEVEGQNDGSAVESQPENEQNAGDERDGLIRVVVLPSRNYPPEQ